MANAIDLTNDVVVNQGDLDAPPTELYKPYPVDIIGVGSSSLAVNSVQLTIRSISDIAPGSDLTLEINRAANITFGGPPFGDLIYNSSEKLASLSAHITDQISGLTLDETLVDNVEGETSVTFESGKYQTFTYNYRSEDSPKPINEIQIYGMGKDNFIVVGEQPFNQFGARTLTYDSDNSALKISFEDEHFAFNIHGISADEAQLMMENPSRYITSNIQGYDVRISVRERGSVCFLRGTLISTQRGLVAIENLEIGDKLPCLNGVRTIKWIGLRSDRVSDLRLVDLEQHLPIRILAGAISHAVPCKDLVVSPAHHVMISGYLVRAGDLVNRITIVQVAPDELECIDYFHVELDQFDMLITHGMYSESWADGGNRDFFQNADVTALRPKDVTRRLASRPGFDHLVLRKGNKLKVIQDRIAKRATQFLSQSKPAVKAA